MNIDKITQQYEQARKPIPLPVTRLSQVTIAQPGIRSDMDLGHVAYMDEKIRAVIDILRERKSLLILDPERLEAQEEEAAAELYPALAEVAYCRHIEDSKAREYECKESDIYSQLLAAAQSAEYPTAKDKEKAIQATTLKKMAATSPEVAVCHNAWLDAQRDRRLAEAYVEAIKMKCSLIHGCQGARNKGL